MRLLHLSDLHYGEKSKNDIMRMYPAFLKKIVEVNADEKIDLIAFTGDLVWCGNNLPIFNEVKDKFIDPLLNSLQINKSNFIICPGNHDMSGQKEWESITDYLNKIITNDGLDDFVKLSDQQFDQSFDKSKNYYEFSKFFYPNDKIEKLYHTFSRKIHEKKVGIVSFHTPWRSFIGNHSGHLLIPN